MRSARRLAVVALLAVVLNPAAVTWAQALSADLSSHLVAITTGFTGASVVLFGATDGPGDVIAVVRGPDRNIAVRRKSRVAGLWINTREVTFKSVPSFYALYATRPLADIAPPALQVLHQLGLANLPLTAAAGDYSSERRATFRAALIDTQIRDGLYRKAPGHIEFLGQHLFRADVVFPANVPVGIYRVEILLVRNHAVVGGQTTPLDVRQTGFDAEVGDFAERNALAYGLLAVAMAAVAGYLASLPFRNA